MSTEDITKKNKGIGVENFHYLNDGLWNMKKIKAQCVNFLFAEEKTCQIVDIRKNKARQKNRVCTCDVTHLLKYS